MNIILLSGGSGKRLWPLSNEVRAKQFLKILKDKHGNSISMLQNVFSELKAIEKETNITIAATSVQLDNIYRQLGNEASIVVEPQRRNTYPAIALSLSYLIKEGKADMEDVALIVPVDTCASADFFAGFSQMKEVVKKQDVSIALMGIKPTYPSAKYGYILPGKKQNDCYMVKSFIEKPSEKMARELMLDGAYWNAGVFAVSIKYVLDLVKEDIGENGYDYILSHYGEMKHISFDYEVVEKAKKVAMIEYSGPWKDLGTWNTLTEEMSEQYSGKTITGENCENTHIINELDIPIVALGTKNLVVAASPDGILVSDKHKSSYLGPYVERMEERPMYEERRWGEYRVLDYTQYADKTKSLTKHLMIEKGKSISYQLHKYRDEVWTIADGEGILLLDGEVKTVQRGEVIYIRAGQKHALYGNTDIHFIEVQIGRELAEDDIERFAWNWEK